MVLSVRERWMGVEESLKFLTWTSAYEDDKRVHLRLSLVQWSELSSIKCRVACDHSIFLTGTYRMFCIRVLFSFE